MKTSSFPALVLQAAIAVSLHAESPRYGIQGLINVPLGDLRTYVSSNLGGGIGVEGTFDLGGGHLLRPRLDYGFYQQATVASAKQNASYFSLGGDYLYFFTGRPEGFYLTAGLSAVRWTFQYQDPANKATNDTTKAGMAAGIGYQWDYNIGTEVRWLHSSVSSAFKADSVQAAVTFRF